MVNGRKVRGRRRYQMIDNIMKNGLYEDTKRKAEKRVEWRMRSLQWKTYACAEHWDWLIDSLIDSHSFISCDHSSHLWFRITVGLANHLHTYNHSGWFRGQNVVHTVYSSIRLWALVNVIQGRMCREWLITILWPRIQPSTGNMSPGVMLVAAATLQDNFHIIHPPYWG